MAWIFEDVDVYEVHDYDSGSSLQYIRKRRAGKYRVIYIHKRNNLEFS